MPDANKTQLTREITNAAQTWLDARGFKPIETEVQVADGWVADLASFCYPTRTEAQKLKLLRSRPRVPNRRADEITREISRFRQWENEYLGIPAPVTAVVEVKTTASDFKKDEDGKFKRPAPSHLLYIAYPGELVVPKTVDLRWGLLSCNKAGVVKAVRHPQLQSPEAQMVVDLIANVAIRRHHFTAYARLREFNQQQRNRDNERINRTRASAAVRMVVKIHSGEMGVDEALAYFMPRTKLPQYEREALEALQPQGDPTE
jgi:hypothetical protein